MDFTVMSDRAILREIGRRIKRLRLDQNITQERVAERAGLSRSTVVQLERGSPSTLLSLLQVLRVLDALGHLDAFLPDPGPSPIQVARLRGRERRRASQDDAAAGKRE